MPSITATTQLSVFDSIKTLIKADSLLGTKFNDRNILNFEPNHKAINFCGFPYIVVRVPSINSDEFVTLNHSLVDNSLQSSIILRMEYEAKDNYTNYANALLNKINSSESTFDALGYYNTRISQTGVIEVVEDQKLLIQGDFNINWEGSLDR